MKPGTHSNLICAVVLCAVVLCSCHTDGTSNKLIDRSDSAPRVTKQFKESPNTAVYTTKFVVNDNSPITLVRHSAEDSTWEFFSDDNFNNIAEVAKIVGLGQIVKIDSTVLEIADMGVGYYAHRKTKADPWTVEKLKEK